MKNSKLVKIVLIITISLAMIIVAQSSFAATSLSDINSLTGITNTGNSSSDSNNVASNNVALNNTTNNTTVLTTNNTSTSNATLNTSLPKTGAADSMPIAVIAVVLVISAVYAYKKIQDYKNI